MASEETCRTMPESYPMKGGDGPLSYAQNSCLQRGAVDAAKDIINQVIANKLEIDNLCSETCNRFLIVDLGCSIGPNTFFAMQNIIEAVEHKYNISKLEKPSTLEFQVYFNDHTTNDFNTLFKSLPSSRQYFAAGVLGSFYDCLFPNSTIHFMHSSSSLNWLSSVPKQVQDRSSPAWNEGRVYCTGTTKEVLEAYSTQFKKDMETFLSCRAKELVNGGLMVLLFGGLPDGIPLSETNRGKTYDILGSCLFSMANKGLISKEKVDSFNLPLYYPTSKELKEVINESGYYNIERMEEFSHHAKYTHDIKMLTCSVRAGFEGIIKTHFGDEIIEEFFENYTRKHIENLFIFEGNHSSNDLVLLICVLKRRNAI